MRRTHRALNVPVLLAAGALILSTLACSSLRALTPSPRAPTLAITETAACVQGAPASDSPARLPTCEPGLVLRGCVRLADGGAGLEGVEIYRGFASYQPVLVATTGADGCYQSGYLFIPGDEMVNVHAQKDGYTFEPADVSWRHYYGYELKTVDFSASKEQ